MCVEILPDETIDTIISEDLRVIQKKRGPKFSVDAVLLARFPKVRRGERVIDLGTGTGVIPLIIAFTTEAGRVVGLEIQGELVDMARRSVKLNGFEGRVEIVEGDVRRIEELFPPESFDLVVCNPPHMKVQPGRMSPDPRVAASKHEVLGKLSDFVRAASYLVRFRGRTAFAMRPARLSEMLRLCEERGLTPKRLKFVHPKPGEEAELFLLEAVKGGGEGLIVCPPEFLSSG